MPKVVREDLDDLNASLTIRIEKKEYEGRFETEIRKYREKAHLKGFRKGKTPVSFIKKAYGQQVLTDLVNEMLKTELYEFIQKEETAFLGQPIPAEDQPPIDFSVRELGDYVFKFDLGKAPEFEVKGVTEKDSYPRFKVKIPKKTVDEEMLTARKRLGERLSVEDSIKEEDILKLESAELEGKKIKEGGWTSTFSIPVDKLADKKVKKEVLGKKKGDTIRFNVFTLEKSDTEHYAKRHLLNMTEEQIQEVEVGEQFEAVILDVTRVIPAELGEAFYDGFFGAGTVKDEKEARKRIEEDISKFYQRQADGLLFRDMQEKLLELNIDIIPLPDEFMKRWLELSDEKNTRELVEHDYENFARSLRWSLIRGKLLRRYEVKITEAEIREGFAERIRNYMGSYYDESFLSRTIDRLMEDQKQVDSVVEDLTVDRLFEKLKETLKIAEKPISIEDFNREIEKARSHPPHDHHHEEEE